MSNGRFGIHGGQYIPETLMNAVIELEEAYNHYKDDPDFNRELTTLLNEYAGRPSRLYYAKRMTEDLGGAKIYLKMCIRDRAICFLSLLFSFSLAISWSGVKKSLLSGISLLGVSTRAIVEDKN